MSNDVERYGMWRALFNTVGAFLIIASIFRSCVPSTTSVATVPTPVTYQQRFCENETLYDFTKKNPEKFTITLHEGCFGDHVRTPLAWDNLFIQKSQAVTDWGASWCDGQPQPSPVRQYYEQLNPFPTCRPTSVGTYDMYLQGRGTVTFKRVGERPQFAAQAEAEQKAPKHYRLTTTPATEDNSSYAIVIEQCYREGEKVKCWGRATNKTDAATNLNLHRGHATDDEGNTFEVLTQYDEGDSWLTADTVEKLLPNVPTKFYATIPDNHMGATKLSMQLKVLWEIPRTQYEDLTFNDIPIQ